MAGALRPVPGIAAIEQRLKAVLKQLVTTNAILFIDEIHTLIGAGGLRRHADAQPAEAGIADRAAEVHRRDHLPGIPRRVEKDHRASRLPEIDVLEPPYWE
jgi:hypothetical protein